jgi:hypothetical protein
MTRFWLVLLCLAACGQEQPRGERREEPPFPELPVEPSPSPPPQPVVQRPPDPPREPARRIVQALEDDDLYGSSERADARRIVYRVLLHVPRSLGDAPPTVPAPAAELHVDVSADRLRARFVGAGWPVGAGSEVRLRGDRPGVYVFDARGGRPLAPGQMAEWFQGGPPGGDSPAVRVRPPPPHEDVGQGALICALLAEWSGQEREGLVRRCGERGPPAMFRLGPWFGERTADVPVALPRSSVRADHESPPRPIAGSDSRAFVDPSLLSRLEPKRARRDRDPPDEDAPSEGLRIRNESRTRVVITGQGIPIGWVDPGADALFVGLREGQHLVAALRPLGQLALHPRGVTVPAAVTIR